MLSNRVCVCVCVCVRVCACVCVCVRVNFVNFEKGCMVFSSKTCTFQKDSTFLPIPHLISDFTIHSLCSLIVMSFEAAKSWDIVLPLKKQDVITARSTTSMAFLAPEDPSLTQLFRKVGNFQKCHDLTFLKTFHPGSYVKPCICLSFYLGNKV